MTPMRFISDGDYIFPFESYYYTVKHFFLWSYQSGTANPDGIIRLPGRVLNLLVFAWYGNIAVGYFFLAFSLLIVFAAFYYFARVFLDNVKPAPALLCSLFFTFNPIFLGNLAKIGLVLAAAMLPPSLAVIRRAFERQRLRYLLLWVVFLNISLIHPFTFTVNFVVTVTYFLYMCRVHRKFARLQVSRFAVIGVTALLLNAYFILPIAGMGTVSKDALSTSVTTTPIDYTSLVDVANTGDVFTGLSLSKNVLKDFEFYSPPYQNFYFLGAFILYVVLLGAYLRVESRLSPMEQKRFGLFLVAFLVLVLLATVKLWHIDSLIKLAIQLPGGWMFRSPLKWQLYIPLVLFGMLAIVLTQFNRPPRRKLGLRIWRTGAKAKAKTSAAKPLSRNARRSSRSSLASSAGSSLSVSLTGFASRFASLARLRKPSTWLYIALGVSFLLMNSFIMVSIYHDLLRPRQLTYFTKLAKLPMDRQNLLIAGSDRCFSFADSHPEVMTELNQVLISKPVQVKQVAVGDIDTINLESYDYVLGCQKTLDGTLNPANDQAASPATGQSIPSPTPTPAQSPTATPTTNTPPVTPSASPLAKGYSFSLKQQFVDEAFQLYANNNAKPYIYTGSSIVALDKPQSLSAAADFAKTILRQPFEVINNANAVSSDRSAQTVIHQATGLQNLFDDLEFGQLKPGVISTQITPIHAGKQTVYIRQAAPGATDQDAPPLYYRQQDNHLALSATPQEGFAPLHDRTASTSQGMQQLTFDIQANQKLQITYKDPAYSYANLLPNPSFEQGNWQKKVGDCYAYDNRPDIAMQTITDDATHGNTSLQLQARNHIACTGPNPIAVTSGQQYLLSFDYKNVGGKSGGYHISFDDPKQTVLNGRLKGDINTWETFTKSLVVPDGATSLQLFLYSYPMAGGATYGTTRYDNFRLAAIPDVQNRFHLVSQSMERTGQTKQTEQTGQTAQRLESPASIQVTANNPTKNSIRISGARTPFFLHTQESYSAHWRLYGGEVISEQVGRAAAEESTTGQPTKTSSSQSPTFPLSLTTPLSSAAATHFRLNGAMNGWLVDPAAVCAATPASCVRQPDSSYDLFLTMEFAPQRLVYIGGIISGLTALGALIYFARDFYNDKLAQRFWRPAKRKRP